jgi:site-specific recombinase XerD
LNLRKFTRIHAQEVNVVELARAQAEETEGTGQSVRLRVSRERSLSEWWPYWELELGARGVRPPTVRNQRATLVKLQRFTQDVEPAVITSDVLNAWKDHMRTVERLRDTSVNRHLLTVGTFFNWLVAEEVLPTAPRAVLVKVKHVEAPRVLDAEALRRMAKGAAVVKQGRSKFEATRDVAMLALLQDTGLRASECAGLLLEHLNLPARQALVHPAVAKGGWPRTVTFGFQTGRLLAKYLRERESYAFSFLPQVFLGRRGAATYTVVRDAVRKAGLRQGVVGARPHLLRHSWASDMKSQGVDSEVLMSLGGWRTLTMPLAYGRAERDRRALEAYARIGSPLDRSRGS